MFKLGKLEYYQEFSLQYQENLGEFNNFITSLNYYFTEGVFIANKQEV